MIRYYLWIKLSTGKYQAAGSLHGYPTIEELKKEFGNIITMELHNWLILEAKVIQSKP